MELPKRCQSLGDSVVGWVHELARRCVMGDFLEAMNVKDSILCAQEALAEGDVPVCATLLRGVQLSSEIFPSLCGDPEAFTTLQELFAECRSTADPDFKKSVSSYGLVTALSGILSATTPFAQAEVRRS